ncbi:ATP-dependent zinc metalloprotease FtsH [Kiritimatiella glycovorans]|uniref:ATP-dependent zinc metalloprotease FtsH n=1 Tax=Kiritimatiella glycovorans TaxID=1307763 RepID=A0A0G3EMM1_9BACT|nr:ATP-dependent zinc metalloprotease FtsH [Kiritimatiella glycovorans]AKJ65354.1 ATP-dependent zinc metalloprotease FtsH [Kiritimatiella glycovorans]
MNNNPDKKTPAPEGGGGGGNKKKAGPRSPFKGFAVWFLLLAMFLMLFQVFSKGFEEAERLSYYPDFVRMVEDGEIARCVIVQEVSGQEYIRGELTRTDPDTGKPERFRVDVIVAENVPDPAWLRENGVEFRYEQQNPLIFQILTGVLPFILVLGLLYFLFARQVKMAGKGAMSFGKSKAKMLGRERVSITFDNVAGVDEAKEELKEVIDFLRAPKKFQKLGGKIPKGVLLSGPPGTGKTLLAKAVAGEAEVPFFSISGSDFVEMFVGVGASRVRDMFEQGKGNAPCIIFIDEIDAVGRSRFSGIGGGHDEREQTLNALLAEMDGFDTQEGVIIIAATNRPDVLDPALLRPGRFDRQVVVDLPKLEGRTKVLAIHTQKINLSPDVDLRLVARGTPGFSGADLANLVNEAALLAARRDAEAVEMQDMEEARDKVCWGRERRSHVFDEEEKRLTAYHEAGHAIVLYRTDQTEPLHKVTILPRGRALGATMQLPEKDRYTESRKRLLGMLTGLMGGRAAEEIVFGEVTTGGQNDIARATQLARAMVCEFGMSSTLGPRNFGANEEVLFLGREINRSQNYSEKTAREIDAEISRILNEAQQRAIDILTAEREKLSTLAETLIERETLDGQTVETLIEKGELPAEEPSDEETQPVEEPGEPSTSEDPDKPGDGHPG